MIARVKFFSLAALCAALPVAALPLAAADGFTDFVQEEVAGNWDFPEGRVGGHASTGVRWTAPESGTVDIAGRAWKIRNRPGSPARLSLWVLGARLIDGAVLSGSLKSPDLFPALVEKSGGDPARLSRVRVQAGDQVLVRIDGNDFAGLDLTIRGGEKTWDLAADFSEEKNPAGPWAYGSVAVDEKGTPNLEAFEAKVEDFDPEDFGTGQPAWSAGKPHPWFWSLMKSRGTSAKSGRRIRYASGQAIYAEGCSGDRWVGRYWSADGRIPVPHEGWADDAFQVGIDGELLSTGWRFVSGKEVERTERGSRHIVVELSHAKRPVRLAVHTLLDGTPVLTRWLEIRNASDKTVALTACSPWAGRLILRRGEHPDEATLGTFTRQDWAYEGWFQWSKLEPGVKTVACDQARSHDDPFFILRNDASGEYFIGHLAWTTQWRMEFERNDSGVLFRVGPWAEKVALRVIAPGETVTTPAVHLGCASGSLDGTVQAMHDHLRRSVIPRRPAARSHLIQYLVPADQGYYVPFDEKGAFQCVDVAAAIGAELFILDYGWWDVTLDWVPSATRFPRGLKPLIDRVREKGMLFGIYVRTEGDSGDVPNSKAGRQHPEWIGPSNTVNLQMPEAAAWVELEIVRLVREHGLDLYRLDYNPSFRFGTTLRGGIPENDCWRYYEAFYSTYERIHRKFPDLILQQAAAGGGRNDLGTSSRFHEPYLTDGLWIPRELKVYSGLTLALPPENFVILHLAHSGGVGMGLPQALDTVLRMSYATSTPQIFVGSVAPSVETLAPERRERFLHYARIYKEFIRPLLPKCRVFHHEPINARGGVTSSGWFAMEYATPDRSKGWAVLARTGPTDADTYLFQPRGLDPGKTYQVRFDSLDSVARVEGLRLLRDGLPIRLESTGSSELLLFDSQAPAETTK